jgi:hypothetical protein
MALKLVEILQEVLLRLWGLDIFLWEMSIPSTWLWQAAIPLALCPRHQMAAKILANHEMKPGGQI